VEKKDGEHLPDCASGRVNFWVIDVENAMNMEQKKKKDRGRLGLLKGIRRKGDPKGVLSAWGQQKRDGRINSRGSLGNTAKKAGSGQGGGVFRRKRGGGLARVLPPTRREPNSNGALEKADSEKEGERALDFPAERGVRTGL